MRNKLDSRHGMDSMTFKDHSKGAMYERKGGVAPNIELDEAKLHSIMMAKPRAAR
jgi:hypothetical protein